MQLYIENAWLLFSIAFGLMLIATLIMGKLGKNFYTKDVLLRRFSILDLEFAATGQEIVNIVRGIYALPAEQAKKVTSSLRLQILVDFLLFMPAVYGGLFVLCMKVSEKMDALGQWFFPLLAWAQIVAFILDAIENFYLLGKIKPDITVTNPATHKLFFRLELVKWGLALLAAICAFSVVLYYWVSGFYTTGSLRYLIAIAIEIFAFIVIVKMGSKNSAKEEIQKFQS